MIIDTSTIREKFLQLLNDSITREDASKWATSLMNYSDEKNLSFEDGEKEQKLWDAILFIDIYTQKINSNVYLYSKEDLTDYLETHKWL